MSRIGLRPIPVPNGTEVKIDGNTVVVTGTKGTLTRTFHRDMTVSEQDGQLIVSRPSDSKLHRSLHGLSRTLLANMVQGVSEDSRSGWRSRASATAPRRQVRT